MSRLRRLAALDEPQETRFFLFLAAFGLVVAVAYWLVAHEAAGTALLAGFTGATGIVGLRLVIDPAGRRVRHLAGASPSEPAATTAGEDTAGGGTRSVDRPFVDESGRLPSETIAPFAVGLGVALAATGLVFGPAPVLLGALPLGWGAWSWLTAARDELDAAVDAEVATGEVMPGGPERGR